MSQIAYVYHALNEKGLKKLYCRQELSYNESYNVLMRRKTSTAAAWLVLGHHVMISILIVHVHG